MRTPGHRTRTLIASVLALASMSLSACTAADPGTAGPAAPGDTVNGPNSCPTEPVAIVVTVDQWGDIVERLAGDCGAVTTIVTGTTGDPHDFEPSPADRVAFDGAAMVVVNGLDYDHWAEQAIDALSSNPAVVDAGEVTGGVEGDNPHLWYDPEAVQAVAAEVTNTLKATAPGAAAYFDDRAADWRVQLDPYLRKIESMRANAGDQRIAATESVFEPMATALGLTDVTPEGFRNAAANESEPSPADMFAFREKLDDRFIDVLIVNTQTEGPVPEQLRGAARDAGVPVVEVTETMPAGATSFVDWQLRQLEQLESALAESR